MRKNSLKLLLLAGISSAFFAGCSSETEEKTTTAKETQTQIQSDGQTETFTDETDSKESASEETVSEEITGEAVSTERADTASHTIVDHAGRTVEIPEAIDSIVVTDTLPLPSVLSLFLDSADEITGISPVSMSAAKGGLLGQLYPEILDADTAFFTGNELNVEALLELEPDLVFYNAGSTAIEEALENAGLTAVAVSVSKWNFDAAETYKQWMLLLEEIFPEREGLADRAAAYSDEVAEEVSSLTSDLTENEKKDVFFLFNYNDTGIVTSGEKFWGQYWCDAVNAVNVSRDVPAEKSNAIVNMEQIYSWDPEVIFISNFTTAMPEDVYENTISDYDWSSVAAVKEKQVFKMPLGAYRTFTPGADTPMTLLWVAKQVYPELFESVDLVSRTQEYYRTVFGVELTGEQAKAIYQ
ncbi:MAG: ABC transporter substrate-binding protein [Lachnospiraceae bacterium]|nr:ABC transporter substrate-binding protein [Lachnospiraceae bacterium]